MAAPIDIALTTSDPDVAKLNLSVIRLHARERMNRLYDIHVDVACHDPAPDLAVFEGARLSLEIRRGGTLLRRFWGFVTEARERHVHGSGKDTVRLRLRPHFAALELVSTLDLHLGLSVPALITEKLLNFPQVTSVQKLDPLAYAARDMMVQYRETDHAFLSRWLEHLGIFYYFVQEATGELLVFGDAAGHYESLASGDVEYVSTGEKAGGVFELEAVRRAIPSYYLCRDYDHDAWDTELRGELTVGGYAGGVYEFGGHFASAADAVACANVRAQEQLARQTVLRGESDEAAFAPGHSFTLNGHPRHDGDKVLIEVEHRASQTVAGWGLDPDDVAYHNRFVAIDATKDYRPPRTTPVPRIPGLVVGIIETGQGLVQDHAIIDADGRYSVRFLFDAAAPGARAPSLPVRMLQAHAGENYGIHFPLKPGIEVAIGFIDGNPDRPVIVGAAPNEHMIPPVTLTDKTKSRIQTRTGILIEFDDHSRMP